MNNKHIARCRIHCIVTVLICAVLGLLVPIAFGVTSIAMRGSESRATVLAPFFIFTAPAFEFGEQCFGQAPVPILVCVGVYWLVIGAAVGIGVLLVSRVVSRIRSGR